jgi:hypothetical protein
MTFLSCPLPFTVTPVNTFQTLKAATFVIILATATNPASNLLFSYAT